MKRMILSLVSALIFLPASSWAFSFFNIASAQIWKVDAHTFRLQVDVKYDGHIETPPAPEGALWASDPSLYFTRFDLTAPSSARNFFSEDWGSIYTDPYQTDASWQSTGSYHTPGTLGKTFGYEFDDFGSTDRVPKVGFTAKLDWCRTYICDAGGGTAAEAGDWLGEESHSGAFIPQAVPEPTTLILLGIGLIGTGIARKGR